MKRGALSASQVLHSKNSQVLVGVGGQKTASSHTNAEEPPIPAPVST